MDDDVPSLVSDSESLSHGAAALSISEDDAAAVDDNARWKAGATFSPITGECAAADLPPATRPWAEHFLALEPLWLKTILGALSAPDRAAATLVCRAFEVAAREFWPVRLPDGTVLEPASTRDDKFNVVIKPGTELQAAFDKAAAGDTILLLPGKHKGPLKVTEKRWVFGRKEATIESRGDVLTCSAPDAVFDGISFHCLDQCGEVSAVFVPDGAARFQNCAFASKSQCTVFVSEPGTSPQFVSCSISEPVAGFVISNRSTPRIHRCDINKAKRTGILVQMGSSPIISNCKLRHGFGGIGFTENSGGVVERCIFTDHENNGIAIQSNSNPLVTRCILTRGKMSAIFIVEGGRGTIEYVLARRNGTSGVFINTLNRPGPLVQYCTLCDSPDTGVFALEGGQGVLSGCNFINNRDHGIQLRAGASLQIDACNITRSGTMGILIEASCTAKISRSDVHGNTVGGIASQGSVVVDDSRIYRNGGPALNLKGGNARIHNTAIFGNGDGTSPAGASNIAVEHSKLVLTDCSVTGAGDYGLFISGESTVMITSCDISSNLHDGATLFSGSKLVLKKSTVRGNCCGIVVGAASKLDIRDCRVEDNKNMMIRSNGRGAEIVASRCRLVGGIYGMSVEDGSVARVEETHISGCKEYGLILASRDNHGPVTPPRPRLTISAVITNSEIVHNKHDGALVQDAQLEMKNCKLNSNCCGIVVEAGGKVDISDSEIHDNGNVAVRLNGAEAVINQSSFRGSYYGLYVQDGAKGRLDQVIITGCKADGVRATGVNAERSVTLVNCRVTDNVRFGVRWRADAGGMELDESTVVTGNQKGDIERDSEAEFEAPAPFPSHVQGLHS